jgi:probable F420-dependent oxidoreductase
MRLGVFVSNEGEFAFSLGLGQMAEVAESAGADGLWVSDHLLLFDAPTTEYPFSEDGAPTWDLTGDYYEALICCATMAAATDRCRIGTAILVLPQRNVFEVAKMSATIDRLSGGRLALGVGAGWYSREMEGLGYDFSRRGKRFDEMLDVLRACWSGRPAPFAGDQIRVPERAVMQPRPVRDAGIPLLVGGMSERARRRATGKGDGWLALAVAESWDRDLLAAQLAEVRDRRGADDPFEALLQLNCDPGDTGQIIELATEAASIGFDEVIGEPPWTGGLSTAGEAIAEVRRAVA